MRRAGRAVRAAAAAGALLAVLAQSSRAEPAIGGVGVRVVAVDGRAPGVGPAYVRIRRPAPSSSTATLEIRNATDRALPVRVAAVDATTSENGGTALLPISAPRRGTGTWITPGREVIVLGADSSTRLRFRIRVPRGATPGDHVGGIVVQPDGVRLRSNANITRLVRVAMAVHVRVPGPASRELEVGAMRVARPSAAGPPTVTVRLANAGNRMCRPALVATLAGPEGAISTERRDVDTILPGADVDYAVRWSRAIADGRYDAQVRAEGCGAPAAVRETVSFDAATGATAGEPAPPSVATAWRASTPLVAAALVALGLVGVGGGWLLARRWSRPSGA